MTKDTIKENLQQALYVIQHEDLIEGFPKVLDSIDYVYRQYEIDFDKLNLAEQVMLSDVYSEMIIKFSAILVEKFFKVRYGIEIKIEESNNKNLVSMQAAYNSETDTILYHPFGLVLNGLGNLSVVQSFLHEARHKLQKVAYKARNLDEMLRYPNNMILLLKDYVFNDYHRHKDKTYYLKNYANIFTEVDAELTSLDIYRRMFNDLLTMYTVYCSSKGIDLDPVIAQKAWDIQRLFVSRSKDIEDKDKDKDKGLLKESVIEETYNVSPVNSTLIVEGKEVDRLIAEDKFIKSHPELVERYPLLKLIINEDYTFKSYDQIIREKEMVAKNFGWQKGSNIEGLYRAVIMSDPILYLTDLVVKKRVREVYRFLASHPTIFKEYPEEIESIIARCEDDDIKSYLEKGRIKKKD